MIFLTAHVILLRSASPSGVEAQLVRVEKHEAPTRHAAPAGEVSGNATEREPGVAACAAVKARAQSGSE